MKNYSLCSRLHSDSDYTFHTYSESNVLNCVLDFQKLAQYQMKLAQLMATICSFITASFFVIERCFLWGRLCMFIEIKSFLYPLAYP
ncbi:hypothetical protein QOZ95_002038 [Paenibacillus brasilensis]|uniref:Uncharacterized protein n=1 Tax=Paenibacillus brasilensis TaxID=128574 RepID=A0ABU0KWV8_9BACL|nr:hypothetical protein [Paenibacillus brasilensis]